MSATATATPPPPPPCAADDAPGVLIFYKYADLTGAAGDEVGAALRVAAEELRLRGRVRVADDGVNAALGGGVGALRQLCARVAALPPLADGARAIDFQARRRACAARGLAVFA
jgi:predicted sulfurtransferase